MEANMFQALHMEQNEVVMCRFLADLLDPESWHGRTEFLESFLEKFPMLEFENAEKENLHLEKTCVMTEYVIDNGRRIDIVLQNPNFFIPIEAKINARDQKGQCYDYSFYTRSAKLVYLTKNGSDPSEWSRMPAGGTDEERKENILPEDRYKCISWEKIYEWLGDHDDLDEVKQFRLAIQSFLEQHNFHLNNQEKNALVHDVLTAFENEIKRSAFTNSNQLENAPHSCRAYQDWKEQNYCKGLNYCPGLSYLVKVNGRNVNFSGGLQMLFRIEVSDDGYLVAGFCLVDTAGKPAQKGAVQALTITDLEQYLHRAVISRDNWWLSWRFSNGKQEVSREDVPNFKTMNQCAADLLDKAKLEKFVEKTIQIFEDQLLGYLKPICAQ